MFFKRTSSIQSLTLWLGCYRNGSSSPTASWWEAFKHSIPEPRSLHVPFAGIYKLTVNDPRHGLHRAKMTLERKKESKLELAVFLEPFDEVFHELFQLCKIALAASKHFSLWTELYHREIVQESPTKIHEWRAAVWPGSAAQFIWLFSSLHKKRQNTAVLRQTTACMCDGAINPH